MYLRTFITLSIISLLNACQSTSKFEGINDQDSYGRSPLHLVASKQYIKGDKETVEMTKLIIKKGGKVDLTDNMGDTPLIIAVNNNKPLTIDALITAQANINSNAYHARTPLMRAVLTNNHILVKQLIEHQAEINITSEKGWTALHIASSKTIAENDEATLVIAELINAGANIDANNQDQCTPLILATLNNKFSMIKQLLNAKANINARDKNGWTPLMHAVANGNQAIIELLLSHQADINIKTSEGWSTLHMVASPLEPSTDKVKAQLARYLIKAGALISATNKQGRTPLHFAASTGLSDTLSLLIQAGANIEQGDIYGWTPLIRAVHLKQITSIDTLISLGAQINHQDNKGWSSLHHAASPIREKETSETEKERNQIAINIIEQTSNLSNFTQATLENPDINIIFKLIESGANTEAKNQNEQTPLYVAVAYQELLISTALLYLGSNVDTYAYNNWTPLYRAISQGNIALVQLLLKYQADVNHKTEKLGWNALMMTTNDTHHANDDDQAQIVPLLLQVGSHIEETTTSGLTASMNAAINGKLAVLKALVENGADIHVTNILEENKTILDYAIENKHSDIELFIKSLSH